MINSKGYVVDKENKSEHLKALTAKAYLPDNAPIQQKILNKPFKIYQESNNHYYFPKFYGIKHFGKPDIIKENEGKNIDVTFNGTLRDNQIDIINKCLEQYNKGGGILSLPCGYGKTTISLYLISKLKKRTLVIVHKEFLMNQWKERIEQFLPDASVGIIQQDNVDTDKDIVMGMLQSLSMKEYQNVFKTFGHIIVDECHHIAAKVFSRALFKATAKYTLGLSATPQRKDRLTWVIESFLGDIFYTIESSVLTCSIQKEVINYDIYPEVHTLRGGSICMPRMITDLCENNYRTQKVLKIIYDIAQGNRKILVLSERREHLEMLCHWTSQHFDCGLYMGGMKKENLKESETKKIIFGTYAMASEGLDIPTLDTLILASPKSDVKQSVGRILRKEGENKPLVIDIVDNYSVFLGQWRKRKAFYKKSNYIEKNNYTEKPKPKRGITLFLDE